jgi:hypothetical protein
MVGDHHDWRAEQEEVWTLGAHHRDAEPLALIPEALQERQCCADQYVDTIVGVGLLST